jgi:hypothetical protein
MEICNLIQSGMSLQIIEQYLTEKLQDIAQVDNFGYKFFLYGADSKLPFVTIAGSDNEYDRISNLDRDGVFRINIGVSKRTFNDLFPVGHTGWDYTALNRFMPHPEYAAQYFICVLNPEGHILSETLAFIEEAYTIAKDRFERKQSNKSSGA